MPRRIIVLWKIWHCFPMADRSTLAGSSGALPTNSSPGKQCKEPSLHPFAPPLFLLPPEMLQPYRDEKETKVVVVLIRGAIRKGGRVSDNGGKWKTTLQSWALTVFYYSHSVILTIRVALWSHSRFYVQQLPVCHLKHSLFKHHSVPRIHCQSFLKASIK